MGYVDLHLHTCYSLLDGIIKPAALVEKTKALGREAVAVTDHGSLGGLVEFHKAANKAGIKPILGMEAYHDRGDQVNYHLVLLARTREGYGNLVKLNNLAQENIYKKPRVSDEMLREHGRGLIVLTACVQGYLPSTVIRGDPDWQWYRAVKGWVDDVYLEVQNHGIPDEERVLHEFMMSGLPCVGTTDAHFLDASEREAHEVGLAISMNKRSGDFKFPGSGYHVRPDSEIHLPPLFLERTGDLAATVESYSIGYDTWQLPAVELDPDQELAELEFRLEDYILADVFGGDFINRDEDPAGDAQEYRGRLAYEFKVIRDNGFLPYFKIVAEICRFVDEDLKSLRGWGRGSAAGSLVAMLYGITKIDPIRWKLYFERFLNPDRITPPDIDLDFKPEDRQPVLEFMRKRWGRVYQIGTYTTLGPREVILSAARAMGVQTGLADFVPVEAPVPPISELAKREAFAARVDAEDCWDFVSVCVSLEGLPRNPSAHASGVIIDVAGEVPVRISKSGANAGIPVTAYDMYSLEDLKLTKIDVLGVNVLSMIDRACRAIGRGVESFPLDDAATFESFNAGNTLGVFQFETHAFSRLIRDLHPDGFDELVDLNTLGRPGCLESGMTEEYIERKHGRRPALPIHPQLRRTGHQNLPLFQEQMMEVARELAGFTLSEADTLRKAIGKKQKDLFESLHAKFVDGCTATNGLPTAEAEEVWATLEKSARYTWNLSHAVAYTMVSYWTMYLSANYPVEWFCELLNGANAGNDTAVRRRMLLSECRRRGIPVSLPDANASGVEYSVSGGRIMLGLSGIKYVGEKAVAAIIRAREDGPFAGSADLKARCTAKVVNSRAIEYLLKAGCFPGEHVPGRDDELEALGYSVSGRAIDQGFLRYVQGAGEVLDVKAITTKKGGEPMCFASVDFHEEVRSVVVFPRQYGQYRDLLVRGAVFGFLLRDDVLEALFDPCNLDDMIVEIPEGKADEFLSFCPSCAGRPNVRAAGYELSSVRLTPELLSFIEAEFGVDRLVNVRDGRAH